MAVFAWYFSSRLVGKQQGAARRIQQRVVEALLHDQGRLEQREHRQDADHEIAGEEGDRRDHQRARKTCCIDDARDEQQLDQEADQGDR